MDHLKSLRDHPNLRLINIYNVSTFVRLSSLLKRDILLPQPITQTTLEDPPEVLPRSVATFLGNAIGIPTDSVAHCWDVLKHDAWSFPPLQGLASQDNEELFKKFSWKLGLTALAIYPPNLHCTNPVCSQATPLKKAHHRQVVVYTLGNGVRPAWSVQLTCPECNTNYRNNYSVLGGLRTYYPGIPAFVQVGEHQFVEEKLVRVWIGSMLIGWFSATNALQVTSQNHLLDG